VSRFKIQSGEPPKPKRPSRHQVLVDVVMAMTPGQWFMVAQAKDKATLQRLQATYSSVMRRHVRRKHKHTIVVSIVEGGIAIKCEERK
jgi:sarcosine oxidase gamma subunit